MAVVEWSNLGDWTTLVREVGGGKVPPETMSVTVGRKTFPVSQFRFEPVAKWEFGKVGGVTIDKPGGLPAGEHQIEYRQHMKISYVPGGFWGKDEKVLNISA